MTHRRRFHPMEFLLVGAILFNLILVGGYQWEQQLKQQPYQITQHQ